MGRSRCRHSLGEILCVGNRLATEDDELRALFADPTPFDQFSLEPNNRAVTRRYSDLAAEIRAYSEY